MQAQQIEILYDNSRTAMLASLVAALSLFFVFVNITPLSHLTGWLAVFLAIAIIRYLLVRRYFQDRRRHLRTQYWYLAFVLAAAVSGGLWGIIGLIFIPPFSNEYLTLIYACMTIIFVCALAAGALTSYAIKLGGFLAFAMPCLLPMGIGFSLSSNNLLQTAGALMLIYTLLLVLMGLRVNRTLCQSLQKDMEHRELSQALEQERDKAEELAARMQTLYSQDGLTGIANRRRFDEFLSREWQRAVRLGEPLSLILGDIDHFKEFNDAHGHQAGDDCLKAVAQVLSRHCRRPSDLAARYGGEEFAVVLANTDSTAAGLIAERLRHGVEQLRLLDGDPATGITMSLGIATIIPRRNDTIVDFISNVDSALYQAKAAGRNNIISDISRNSRGESPPRTIQVGQWDKVLDGPFTSDRLVEHFRQRHYFCMFTSFNPDNSIGTHAHMNDEVNLVTAGEMLFNAGERDYRLSAGQYIFIPARTLHRAEVTGSNPARLLIATRQATMADTQDDNRICV